MIAAQQYYIEYGTDINAERLYGLLPNYIPDYCLQTDNALDTWNGLILQAYKKVSKLKREYHSLVDSLWTGAAMKDIPRIFLGL